MTEQSIPQEELRRIEKEAEKWCAENEADHSARSLRASVEGRKAEHLRSLQRPGAGPIWVKASNRLPEKYITIFFRYEYAKGSVLMGTGRLIAIKDGELLFNASTFCAEESHFKNVEWLDESGRSPAPEAGKEQKEIAEPDAFLEFVEDRISTLYQEGEQFKAEGEPDLYARCLVALSNLEEVKDKYISLHPQHKPHE